MLQLYVLLSEEMLPTFTTPSIIYERLSLVIYFTALDYKMVFSLFSNSTLKSFPESWLSRIYSVPS